MAKAKTVINKSAHRPMVRVLCPIAAATVWANGSTRGPRCTKCGTTGHLRVGP